MPFKNNGPGGCCCVPGNGDCTFVADYFDDRTNEDDTRWATPENRSAGSAWKVDLAGQYLYCTGPNPGLLKPPGEFISGNQESTRIRIYVEGPAGAWIGFRHPIYAFSSFNSGPWGYVGFQIGGPADVTSYNFVQPSIYPWRLSEMADYTFDTRCPTRVLTKSNLLPDVINLIEIEHTSSNQNGDAKDNVTRWFCNGELVCVTSNLYGFRYTLAPGSTAPFCRILCWPGTRTNLGLPNPPTGNDLILEDAFRGNAETRQSNGPIKIHSIEATYGQGKAFADEPNPDVPCPFHHWLNLNEWRTDALPWPSSIDASIAGTYFLSSSDTIAISETLTLPLGTDGSGYPKYELEYSTPRALGPSTFGTTVYAYSARLFPFEGSTGNFGLPNPAWPFGSNFSPGQFPASFAYKCAFNASETFNFFYIGNHRPGIDLTGDLAGKVLDGQLGRTGRWEGTTTLTS